jgi:hypothetical protein
MAFGEKIELSTFFMGRYSDTNVEKSAILLLKIEQNNGFLEI